MVEVVLNDTEETKPKSPSSPIATGVETYVNSSDMTLQGEYILELKFCRSVSFAKFI